MEFLVIEDDGDTICDITMYNYSVLCWGKSEHMHEGQLVYNPPCPAPARLSGPAPTF
jgi:hypothetical protein